jgi:excisionase family DNA binding protein
MPRNPHQLVELPATLSIEEAGRLLGYSRDVAYAAARSGTLPTIRLSKRKSRVPTHRLLELLEGAGQPDVEDKPEGA